MSGGIAEQRGEPAVAPTLTLRSGAPLVLTLRPATRVEGPLVASATIERAGEQPHPLSLSLTISPDGAVRMKGVLEDLAMASGPAELCVRIARSGADSAPVIVRRPITWAAGQP